MLYLDVPWCIYQDLSGTSVNRIILGLQGLARNVALIFQSAQPAPWTRSSFHWWKHILPLVDIMGHSEFNDQWGKFRLLQNNLPPETCLLLLRLAARPVQFPLLVEPQELKILQRPPQISVIVIPWNIPMKYPHEISPWNIPTIATQKKQ